MQNNWKIAPKEPNSCRVSVFIGLARYNWPIHANWGLPMKHMPNERIQLKRHTQNTFRTIQRVKNHSINACEMYCKMCNHKLIQNSEWQK